MAESISFYSYKGGVGRSLILANVAALLAKQGKRVVCIDFDLEAAGLHTIFGIPADKISFNLLDLLSAPTSMALEHSVIDLTSHISECHLDGRLWLLPTISETSKLLRVLAFGRDLSMLLGGIISQVEDLYNPHFILIDTRTGFSELASISIIRAERLVCVLRPNRQNVDGLRLLLDVLDALPSTPDALLVLSQIPEMPGVNTRIEMLQTLLGAGRRFEVRIPYIPELALDEAVSSMEKKLARFSGLFQEVADWLNRGLHA